MESNKKNNEHFLKEREKWLKQDKEYKGKDYYQFKDISYEKWNKTKESKEERQSFDNLKKIVDKAAKEHPLYSKNYEQLPSISTDYVLNKPITVEKINIGQEVVNSILNDIRDEAIKKQKQW